MMKILKYLIAAVIAVPVLLFGSIYAASELGGEVVTLHRANADGSHSEVRVWIVDQDNNAWIEHGAPDAYWMNQLGASNQLQLTRNGVTSTYVAAPDPAANELYYTLRRDKYGWAHRFLAVMGGGEADGGGVPVRLTLEH